MPQGPEAIDLCYEGPFSEEELPSATPARATAKVEQRSGLKSNAKAVSARRGASDGRFSKETMAQVHFYVATVIPMTYHLPCCPGKAAWEIRVQCSSALGASPSQGTLRYAEQ